MGRKELDFIKSIEKYSRGSPTKTKGFAKMNPARIALTHLFIIG